MSARVKEPQPRQQGQLHNSGCVLSDVLTKHSQCPEPDLTLKAHSEVNSMPVVALSAPGRSVAWSKLRGEEVESHGRPDSEKLRSELQTSRSRTSADPDMSAACRNPRRSMFCEKLARCSFSCKVLSLET